MSFEWRTDEDDNWPEEREVVESPVVQSSFWQRRWRFLLMALVGLLGVWLVVQWQIDQRVHATTNNIETEILATHNFVLQTAVSQDQSLFQANLSGRNPDWTALQGTLLNEGLLLNRPMLGWQHEPSVDRLTTEEVTFVLDPDLQGATLLYPQTYAIQTGAQVTETVVLQQTAVYRAGTSRWLYSPPLGEFWGDWATWTGDTLTLAYPERDEETATRLGADLDALLGQMCRDLADLNCGADFRVHLRLGDDPELWLALDDIETLLTAGLRLELPAPTLVGLPTDEASYQVLFRAYGVQVATAVLAHQIDYECCAHQLFFRALRDYQLDQLGLQPWPLTPAMFQQMLDFGFDGNLFSHWTRRWEEAPPQFLQVWRIEDPDPLWQQVYMLVEFLAAEETAVSPTEMMRLMNRNSYNGWLANVLGGGYDSSTFQRRLLTYIYSQSLTGQQAEPPIPLPQGAITLVCPSYEDGPTSHVYSYNLPGNTWTERFRDAFADVDGNLNISTIDGEHFIVSQYRFENGITYWKYYLATADNVFALEETEFVADNEHWLTYSWVDEDAEFLLRRESIEGEIDLRLRQTSCATGDCPTVQLDGYPAFAPGKAHLLVEGAPDERIYALPDVLLPLLQNLYLMTPEGTERQYVGQGGEPFWLNDTVYGFAQMVDEGWELVTAVLNQNQPRYLLNQTEFLDAIPASERPVSLRPPFVLPDPANPQELIFLLRDAEADYDYGPETPSYLFKAELDSSLSEVVQLDFLRAEAFTGIFGFEPNGRSLVHGNYSFNGSDVTWYIMDPQTGETQLSFDSIGSLPTSEDGEWYLQLTDNYLLLHAVNYDYQYFIPHGYGECRQVLLAAAE